MPFSYSLSVKCTLLINYLLLVPYKISVNSDCWILYCIDMLAQYATF